MITLEKNTEKKLMNYVSHFDGSYDKMITSILSYRVSEIQKAVKMLKTDFMYFEKKYSMDSASFYNLFEEGKLGDENMDFFQWSGEYEVYIDYQQELKQLL